MNTETIQTGPNHRLQGKIYSPATDPTGVFVCIHGLGDHGQHFEGLAGFAASAGFATATMDLPGHGDSPGRRGHARSYDDLLASIACLRRDAERRFPRIPQTIIGHSMGGNLAVNYMLRCSQIDSELSGDSADRSTINSMSEPESLILLSPMFLPPQHVTRPQIFAAWLTGYVLPAFRVEKKANVTELTSDVEEARQIAGDPKRHGKLSIYLATQLLSQGRWALDHARELKIPTLLLYGESDSMVDREAIQNAAIRIGLNATLVSWPNGRHDLMHDADKDLVMKRLMTWMESTQRERTAI